MKTKTRRGNRNTENAILATEGNLADNMMDEQCWGNASDYLVELRATHLL